MCRVHIASRVDVAKVQRSSSENDIVTVVTHDIVTDGGASTGAGNDEPSFEKATEATNYGEEEKTAVPPPPPAAADE
ncbi:unnamed protein product [Sphagnum troendelagicum]|uniref:Uncharacterized protein n=1 Tax=Sphagnum troendelagicum TaxID=128251 RepID=A0ABP0UD72_9BRYO